jgi:hypothetical protein
LEIGDYGRFVWSGSFGRNHFFVFILRITSN